MALFSPTAAVDRVTDITPELLKSLGIKAVLLDVDNTLAEYGSQNPLEGSVEWSRAMTQAGIKTIILSNNFKERVEPFAAKYGIPFLCFSLKPLPFAYWRAARILGAKRREAAVVGDQVFTDVIGANLAGMKSILLVPIRMEHSLSFRIRRRLELPVRRKSEGRGK